MVKTPLSSLTGEIPSKESSTTIERKVKKYEDEPVTE